MKDRLCDYCGESINRRFKNTLTPIRISAVMTKNIVIPEKVIFRWVCENCKAKFQIVPINKTFK